MLIIGCDFHTRYQQIAMAREETSELLVERRLDHESGEAQAFYRNLQSSQNRFAWASKPPVRFTGSSVCSQNSVTNCGLATLRRFAPAKCASRRPMNATRALILDLLLAKRFPKIWVPTPAERDLRQLLWHRHKLVRMRTMLGNQLHFLAMSQGLVPERKAVHQEGPHRTRRS